MDISKKETEGGRSQKEKLFRRGKLMSGHPKSTGSIQLPNPPIKIGITEKKIIISAWEVTTVLYIPPDKILGPADLNSYRIIDDKADPIRAIQTPKMKYSVPISLWLVDINQRVIIKSTPFIGLSLAKMAKVLYPLIV
jgi:hypothetical protein